VWYDKSLPGRLSGREALAVPIENKKYSLRANVDKERQTYRVDGVKKLPSNAST
jgi:hypothetical protein